MKGLNSIKLKKKTVKPLRPSTVVELYRATEGHFARIVHEGFEEDEQRFACDETPESIAGLLWEIKNNLHDYSGKYCPKNINIAVEPGIDTSGNSDNVDYCLSQTVKVFQDYLKAGKKLPKEIKKHYETLLEDLSRSVYFKKKSGYEDNFIESVDLIPEDKLSSWF